MLGVENGSLNQKGKNMKCARCGKTDETKLVVTAMGVFCRKHRTEVQTFW